MAFEHLSRHERRAMAIYSRAEAAKRPKTLTDLPKARWPRQYLDGSMTAPRRAFESSKFLAQLYDAPPFEGIEALRLSVCRVTIKQDGRWDEGISWEELMQIKREIGYGHWYGVEIYPPDDLIVNVANLRHLWMFLKPLRIGWLGKPAPRIADGS